MAQSAKSSAFEGSSRLRFAPPRSWTGHLAGAPILGAWLLLIGCTGGNSSSTGASPLTYSLDATISGLTSPGLVLTVNATAVSVEAGASMQTLASSLPAGSSYSVTVQTQPTGENCSIARGSGMIQSASPANVAVTCVKQTYSVGGSISGLNGPGLVLANGTDTLAVSAGASSFTMPTAVAYSSSYAVTVRTQPTGLSCSVSNGTGTMGSAAVTNVALSCSGNTLTVGGTISGLTASGLVLLNNGADATALGANATQFTMNTRVAQGSAYAIAVQSAPTGLACLVSNGTGTVGAADITNVSIACGPNFTLLYSFAGGSGDGSEPYHSLIQASDGNFYGTTLAGGATSGGTIFEITPSGTETIFYSFPAAGSPFAGVTQASDGNFYGTTDNGGTSGRGTIFKLTPGGTETILYSIPPSSSVPYTGVIQGSDGNFYGTTGALGSTDDGVVFEITPSGTETVLHFFPKTGSDGQSPFAALIQGRDGNFYGTTHDGGASGLGTVFEITPSGTETILYSFAGGSGDGAHPYAAVIQGSDGNFYGTTTAGGTSNSGTVFRLTPSGTETVLYSFAGGSGDGANPEAGLIQGRDGNFYGMTYQGGSSGLGTIFEITPNGTESVLHVFAGGASDGANPWTNLVQGSDGNLYGSTYAGGSSGDGTFFKLALQ